jgi:hypothetical protein
MLLAYSFLDVMWSMLVFFCWILWFWLLFTVWADVFRRHDIGGWAKAGWLIFTIVLPFLGVFVYLIAEGHSMAERSNTELRTQQAQLDQYVRETAGTGGAAEIERAKSLLDSGAISQDEFNALKQKALAV